MSRFLDMRIADNSGTVGFPGTPVPTTAATAAVVGQIGLQTQGVVGKVGLGGLIVNLQAVVGISPSITPGTVVLRVARATTIAGPFTTIHTANHLVSPVLTLPSLVSVQASDVSAPSAAELVYQLLVHTEGILTLINSPVRSGPESFYGIAMDGDSPPA
ncbi:hypothetical protein [Cohnella luojiensis]|uniref:Uncharacterized protein n=1 Tax=Cohnella luojiensis TaxID=652876 RepID=A0A4Y8M0U5_9BACL|nr:hypothetical protein [Cohnella luojiensis]TFE27846.1 hypothetical protein E2980_08675 [Cohnella luojiensis]